MPEGHKEDCRCCVCKAKKKRTIVEETKHSDAVQRLGKQLVFRKETRGRKTLFREEMIEEGSKLAGLGLNMEEMAIIWNASLASLKRWANRHKLFRAALKSGRLKADREVESSLFKRALGFEITERHYEVEYQEDNKAIKMLKKEIVKHVMPDVTAQIFWLKNRRPDKWRDDRGISLFGPEGEPVSVQYIPAKEFLKLVQGKDGVHELPQGTEKTKPPQEKTGHSPQEGK